MKKNHTDEEEQNDFSMSIGDLMAAVLFIFVILLVGAVAMLGKKTEQVKAAKDTYFESREVIRKGLHEVLDSSQKEYMEIIDSSLVIRIKSDKYVMFKEMGDTILTPSARNMLRNFFPKYLAFLTSPTIRDKVGAVSIEGHCNTVGSYEYNMALSQDRARNVLFVCESLIKNPDQKKWMRNNVTAVGYSFSRLLYLDSAKTIEDTMGSMRVEFCVSTKDALLADTLRKIFQ